MSNKNNMEKFEGNSNGDNSVKKNDINNVDEKPTPEEIAQWREEHKDEINKSSHRFMKNKDGTITVIDGMSSGEVGELYREVNKKE